MKFGVFYELQLPKLADADTWDEDAERRIFHEMLDQVQSQMRWPRLGANLDLESVKAGKPVIEFERERFSTSEAIMYYEFTVDTAISASA